MSNDNGQTSTALALKSEAGLTMVVAPSEAEERLHELQDFVRRNMVAGEDYGVIPGTSPGKDKDGRPLPPKPVLLQPGAQKLAEIYGLAVTFEDTRPPIERWDDGDPMFAYFKRAVVTRRTDGQFLGSGVGSCNSKEKKYASRWVFDNQIPPGLDVSKLQRKEGVSAKNGRPFVQYKVPNPEIFDLVNTIEKMACKRALVAAMISVTRSAGIFTQDMEDIGAPPNREGRPRADVEDAEFEEAAPPPPKEPTAEDVTRGLVSKLPTATDPEVRAAWDTVEPFPPKLRKIVRGHCIERWIALAELPEDVERIVAMVPAQGFPPGPTDKLLKAAAHRTAELRTAPPADVAPGREMGEGD